MNSTTSRIAVVGLLLLLGMVTPICVYSQQGVPQLASSQAPTQQAPLTATETTSNVRDVGAPVFTPGVTETGVGTQTIGSCPVCDFIEDPSCICFSICGCAGGIFACVGDSDPLAACDFECNKIPVGVSCT